MFSLKKDVVFKENKMEMKEIINEIEVRIKIIKKTQQWITEINSEGWRNIIRENESRIQTLEQLKDDLIQRNNYGYYQ
jgi:hypothetical protein